MAEQSDRNSTLALGELRGLLTAFAWANTKCDHTCTFTIEELPSPADMQRSLTQHFGEWATKVSITQLVDWRDEIDASLQRWLFMFHDLVRPGSLCSLTSERDQREMVKMVLAALVVALQPLEVFRVNFLSQGHYECDWVDYAIHGKTGLFLLHLGASD